MLMIVMKTMEGCIPKRQNKISYLLVFKNILKISTPGSIPLLNNPLLVISAGRVARKEKRRKSQTYLFYLVDQKISLCPLTMGYHLL